MTELLDTYSDKRIKACIRNGWSFSVVAGAGSGKTTSLVKALDYVRTINGANLKRNNQKVACITFTNRAVDVIVGRLNADELFHVSTLHGFLWKLIAGFNNEIRTVLKNTLIPNKIAKKTEDDNGGQSKKAREARNAVERLNGHLANIDTVLEFHYEDTATSNYTKGQLNHDDIIAVAALMISEYPLLRKVIGQKYPYIFIDEAQDTFPDVVEALNLVCADEGLPLIGYFGDPMQQIYDKRAGDFAAPTDSKKIKKKENYRCSRRVIDLLNAFRTDVTQIPGPKNKKGSVQICLVKAEQGEGPRKVYTDEQLVRAGEKFNEAIELFDWTDDNEVKRLFLARQMIARRLNFSNLHNLFNGPYSSSKSQEDFEAGKHFLLKPLIDVLLPVVNAHRDNNPVETLRILRGQSPLLDPRGRNATTPVKDVVAKANHALDQLVEKWQAETIGEILIFSRDVGLFHISDRLNDHLNRGGRDEEYDEDLHAQEKGDWLADSFFDQSTSEITSYLSFIQDETPFSTQHGVKGEEYKKVLVTFDDTEANWNNYSFSKLLAPVAAGKEPTDGQRERSQKLAYVCFSRAEEDLRIILFTLDPDKAKQELVGKKLFEEEQVIICK